MLPGVEYRLRQVEGIQEGGVLEVRGPNVMIGYLRSTAPGVIEPLTDGWYDTGDVVTVDEEGFLSIVGRARRFAKVAGEMISLLTVERVIEDASADARCAIVVRRHPTRGEELVLFTDSEWLTRAEVQGWIREAGLSPSWAPRDVRCITSIPLLPSGKINYAMLEEALMEEAGARESESTLPG
jgi:acyl-[acyl-carrier-protein]-phospholipid O-acyltransferase/long-chain-fatty-acid--[acyl-carrier-protein] ligase